MSWLDEVEILTWKYRVLDIPCAEVSCISIAFSSSGDWQACSMYISAHVRFCMVKLPYGAKGEAAVVAASATTSAAASAAATAAAAGASNKHTNASPQTWMYTISCGI